MAEAAPKGFGLSLAVAVIAVFIGIGAIGFAYTGTSTQATSLQSQVSAQQTEISALMNKTQVGAVNVVPSTMAVRVDWCNTDSSGQDRFCPASIVVPQGDTVQILFETNDTDAHTFTLIRGGYNFQLNNTLGAPNSVGNFSTSGNGMHDFLTNGYFQASCQNGAYAQESQSVSPTYCVSGTDLLAPGGTFAIPVNPFPAAPPLAPNTPKSITIDNLFHVNYENATNDGTWSIGSFQASIAGIYEYFCYYHVSNGMFGYIIVLPNTYCSQHASACGSTTGSSNSTSTG
jgi:plastocyanin